MPNSGNIHISNSTLSRLIKELDSECKNVTDLIDKLKLPRLSDKRQAEILAELLSATIHLHVHCGEDFQKLIIKEMEKLPDDDEQ
jgi:hypothetical protein